MLYYIIQTIAFQLFFLIIYDLFLKKETFFNWNRAYLLTTSLLSLILPFIKIDRLKNVVPENYVLQLPEIFIGQNTASSFSPLGINIVSSETPFSIWSVFVLAGIIIASVIFLYKIARLWQLIDQNPKQKKDGVLIVLLHKSNAAFSFFNYIFLGEKILAKDKSSILDHEIVHVKQKHTFDLLYFEILRILFWFNPLIYMYQHKISTLHEFIADAKASKDHNKKEYYQNLLSQVFETQNISFINTFFKQSLIKKRIVMLSKVKSKQIHLLKYTVLIPMVVGMLIYTSCNNAKAQDQRSTNLQQTTDSTTPLLKKIKAMKKQMEIQGHSSEKEEKGFDLLLKVITGTSFDAKIVEEVHAYTAIQNKTPLMQKIADVFEQIQIQGNISEEEEKALKTLLMLITENGLSNPLFQDVVQYAEIPFGVIDQVPVYPGCEDLSKKEQKKCMTTNVTQHVIKNFNIKVADSLKLKGKIKIFAVFKVSNKGVVEDIKIRAPHKALEKEAKRVIAMIPNMKPGEHKGKAVNVPYSLPIIFEIKE